MSAYRMAQVYVLDKPAGLLEETDAGYRFAYAPTYLASEHPLAVSLTLPLRREPYLSTTLFSFFDGLIPEGWLLDVVAHNWKLNRADRFGLLLAACRDFGCSACADQAERTGGVYHQKGRPRFGEGADSAPCDGRFLPAGFPAYAG